MYKNFCQKQSITRQTETRFNQTLKFFAGKLNQQQKILDLGNRNDLAALLEKEFVCKIDNTDGDIDNNFYIPGLEYDIIICSHILEHVFNPLSAMQRLRLVIKKKWDVICWLAGASEMVVDKKPFSRNRQVSLKCTLY